MAQQYQQNNNQVVDETNDRGLFSCFGKKDEQPQHVIPTLKETPRGSNSSSSSSSEEEVDEGGKRIRRRKKKGLKNKGNEDEMAHAISVEQKYAQQANAHNGAGADHHHQENKGMMDKIKEKLPGADRPQQQPPQENKGMMEKIKEKIPGMGAGADHQQHPPQENKGIFEKIKEKIPGVGGAGTGGEHYKKEHTGAPPVPVVGDHHNVNEGYNHYHAGDELNQQEKKGIFEKIKDKLPGGGHHDGQEVKKDH